MVVGRERTDNTETATISTSDESVLNVDYHMFIKCRSDYAQWVFLVGNNQEMQNMLTNDPTRAHTVLRSFDNYHCCIECSMERMLFQNN